MIWLVWFVFRVQSRTGGAGWDERSQFFWRSTLWPGSRIGRMFVRHCLSLPRFFCSSQLMTADKSRSCMIQYFGSVICSVLSKRVAPWEQGRPMILSSVEIISGPVHCKCQWSYFTLSVHRRESSSIHEIRIYEGSFSPWRPFELVLLLSTSHNPQNHGTSTSTNL